MSSSRSHRSGGSGQRGSGSGSSSNKPRTSHVCPLLASLLASSSSSSSPNPYGHRRRRTTLTAQKTIQQLIDALVTHRVNTLTELRRIEQVAAACENEDDARRFQEPMTAAWLHYVSSNQFLSELRGLTPDYPFSSDLLADAHQRVVTDPLSNRSWNLAWLCLCKIRDDGLLPLYAVAEANKPDMWGYNSETGEPYTPADEEVARLAQCFEYEWTQAVTTLLRHWATPPTWY
ncbi:hypothetical protein SCUCBS95973_007319 [Sporothrix curviconia]|uniref:Uncharacterized protein n=1 Tax=Sporothrix curviconia TaxID=1260050 RepID=A0ABP0CDM2_9PEZI